MLQETRMTMEKSNRLQNAFMAGLFLVTVQQTQV